MDEKDNSTIYSKLRRQHTKAQLAAAIGSFLMSLRTHPTHDANHV